MLHDGVEGTVLLVLHVSASGELRNVISVNQSGDERLDNQQNDTLRRCGHYVKCPMIIVGYRGCFYQRGKQIISSIIMAM